MRDRRAGNDSATRLLWVAGAMISVLFIVAVSYAFYGERGAANMAQAPGDGLGVGIRGEKIPETDTDGDGLPDWEEALWDTDPNNPDTDGDGVNDQRSAVAVADWRDAGAGFDAVRPGDFSAGVTNATQVIAQELLGTYMTQVQQQNPSPSAEDQNVLVENALRASVETLRAPTFTLSDAVTVPVSAEASATYVRNLKNAVVNVAEGAEQDSTLLVHLSAGDADAAEGLVKRADHYKEQVETLKNMAVPEDVASAHVQFVSALMGYAHTLEGIASYEEDPIRAAAALQMLMVYDTRLSASLDALHEYVSLYE